MRRFLGRYRTLPVLFAAFSCAAVCRAAGDLWPGASRSNALAGTRATSAREGVLLTFSASAKWPGYRVRPKKGTFDFSQCRSLLVGVSNTLDKLQTVHVKLRPRGGQLFEVGSCRLAPKANGIVQCFFDRSSWQLDKTLDLSELRGAPLGPEGCRNVKAISEIHIFRKNAECPEDGSFLLRYVRTEERDATRPVLKADDFFPFVDRFGQFKHVEWPAKIKSAQDLKDSCVREEQWLKACEAEPIKNAGRYGGWTGGFRMNATGRFRVEKKDGVWWLIDPEGLPFFSLGIAGIRSGESTRISGRRHWFEDIPENARHFDFAERNLRLKYGKGYKFNAHTHRRLKAWGINTIGNWSAVSLRGMRRTAYVADLATKGRPIEGARGWSSQRFPDPFDTSFSDDFRVTAEAEAVRSADDPWCIGWFVDNELPWSNDDRYLARGVLLSPSDQPAKVKAMQVLKRRYADISELNRRWGTNYSSWDDFLHVQAIPRGTGADADLRLINLTVADAYFRTVREIVKAAAPHVLYLGCRFASGGEDVWRTASRYCDVVSANIYCSAPVYTWPSGAEDKPLIVGEFHFKAGDVPNFSTAFTGTARQGAQAEKFETYVRRALSDPRIVGAHWFKWRDQTLTGRGDGENFAIGFVDVCDSPRRKLVEASRKTAADMYLIRSALK